MAEDRDPEPSAERRSVPQGDARSGGRSAVGGPSFAVTGQPAERRDLPLDDIAREGMVLQPEMPRVPIAPARLTSGRVAQRWSSRRKRRCQDDRENERAYANSTSSSGSQGRWPRPDALNCCAFRPAGGSE